MEDMFTSVPEEVIFRMVKLAQKRGMKGDNGDWKEFLKICDKNFGARRNDPAKRTPEVLRAFLNTFQEEEDLQFFKKLLHSHERLKKLKQVLKSREAASTEEERLVSLTLGQPESAMESTFPSHEETSTKGHGDKYIDVAISGSPEAVLDWYESLHGDEEIDSFGQPHKLVPVQLKSGSKATIYVRKMARDIPFVSVLGKRPNLTEATVSESTRLKTEQSTEPLAEDLYDPVKEVERLNNSLNQIDLEISSLHEFVGAMTRKQDL